MLSAARDSCLAKSPLCLRIRVSIGASRSRTVSDISSASNMINSPCWALATAAGLSPPAPQTRTPRAERISSSLALHGLVLCGGAPLRHKPTGARRGAMRGAARGEPGRGGREPTEMIIDASEMHGDGNGDGDGDGD